MNRGGQVALCSELWCSSLVRWAHIHFIVKNSRLSVFEREEGQKHLTDKRFDIVTAEGQEVSCLEGTHRTSLSGFQARGWLPFCVPSVAAMLP